MYALPTEFSLLIEQLIIVVIYTNEVTSIDDLDIHYYIGKYIDNVLFVFF